MPSRKDFLSMLIDCVNSSFNSYCKDTVLLDRKLFSALTLDEISAMWNSNYLLLKGTIKFGSSKELLGDIKLPESFLQQLDTVYDVDVDDIVSIYLRTNR